MTVCMCRVPPPTVCPAGSFCPAQSSAPTLCFGGFYGATTGKATSACDGACPIGTGCPNGTAGVPVACAPGSWSAPASGWVCTPCAAGFWGSAAGLSTYRSASCAGACTCAVGHACAPGSTAAGGAPCALGMYAIGGVSQCEQCASAGGYYCPAGAASSVGGMPCPIGTWCAGDAQGVPSSPTPCDAGGYWCPGACPRAKCASCRVGYFGLPGRSYTNDTCAGPCTGPPGTACVAATMALDLMSMFPATSMRDVVSYEYECGMKSAFCCAAGYTCAGGSSPPQPCACAPGSACPPASLPGAICVPCAAMFYCEGGSGAQSRCLVPGYASFN